MKAVVQDRYGGPEHLRLTDIPVPEPRASEVRVKVLACAVNLSDWEYLVGDPLYARLVGGLFRPKNPALGSDIVTPFKFTRKSKAQLGVDFVALVETNRFKYFESAHEFDDAWWFFEQARHCVYELAAGRPMERDLRWFVPGTARVSGPQGRAESRVIKGVDPVEELSDW